MARFLPNHFLLLTAYFWNAARTGRSPGFLGLALQRAVKKRKQPPLEGCFREVQDLLGLPAICYC
jgi:hypothetical protein